MAGRRGERLERWSDEAATSDEGPAPEPKGADNGAVAPLDETASDEDDHSAETVERSVEEMLEAIDAGTIRAATPDTVRVVLFDLDNTLVDFMRVKRLASESCARAMIAAGADFGSPADKVADMLFHHYLEHGIESDDAFQTFLRRYQRNRLSYSQHQIDKVLAAGINAYLRTKDLLLAPYPGVRAALVGLVRNGYRMGVVTDAPRLKAWQRLHAVGIAEFFDIVVTRTDAGFEKPHGRGFLVALEALGAQPWEAAMVGDWAERDVAGGNRLGIYTILAQYGAQSKIGLPPAPRVEGVEEHETEADAIAERPGDLLDLLGPAATA